MTANMTPIPDDVFEFFASDPDGPHTSLRRVADDPRSKVHSSLNCFLEEIPPGAVELTRKDPQFLWFWDKAANIDREARIWIAERLFTREISHSRIQLLTKESAAPRPRPYSTPALADLDVDHEHLVRLSDFEFDGSRLLRNGYAFTILCTTQSPNSTYWLLNVLYNERLENSTSVRLDPYLWGSVASFPQVSYRMLVYGKPLDWTRISRLREIEHGRWLPDASSHASQFTEFCWAPRGNEISFVCEEVPLSESVSEEGARYLHAVYEPGRQEITHFDGALRIYTAAEIALRKDQHVRNAGKVGLREKVVRTDQAIPRHSFAAITQAFFIWNQDVAKYFRQIIADASQSSG